MLGKPLSGEGLDVDAFAVAAGGEVDPIGPAPAPAAVGDAEDMPNMFLRKVVFTLGAATSALLPGVEVVATDSVSPSPPPPPRRISFFAAFFAAFSALGACFCLAPVTYCKGQRTQSRRNIVSERKV